MEEKVMGWLATPRKLPPHLGVVVVVVVVVGGGEEKGCGKGRKRWRW